MSNVKSGNYDFFKCTSCKRDFAISNRDNQKSVYDCPICGGTVLGDNDWIGQIMIETGEQ